MRRGLLMLLVVLLPFNGWAGVASLRCLHEAAGGETRHVGHVRHVGEGDHAGRDDPRVHGDHAVHASPSHHGASPSHHGAAHSHHDAAHSHHDAAHGGSVTHADPAAQSDATASAASEVDCAHADCGGCCHASGSVAVGFARLSAAGAALGGVLATVADAAPDSPALDGPFRPPRTASA